jgi:hypothetical protein
MSNEVSLFAKGGLPPVDMNAYKQALKATASASKAALGGLPFLRLLRDGTWVYGADSTEVEEKSLWALNSFSMALGWIAWGDEGSKDEGTVMGEEMARIGEPPIQRGNLPDVGAEWTPCVSFDLLCISGEDKGTTVRYKSNSVGGRRAFSDMLQLVSSAMDDGSGKCIPIVELDCDSYPHKKYGKIYTPIFDVKKWVMPDATELGGTSAPAVEEKQAPAAPQTADEGTVRRRRR